MFQQKTCVLDYCLTLGSVFDIEAQNNISILIFTTQASYYPHTAEYFTSVCNRSTIKFSNLCAVNWLPALCAVLPSICPFVLYMHTAAFSSSASQGWEEPPSKAWAAMRSSTMAHWHQLHHNFITASSLWILLTLTFYRDWQHGGRDAWQRQLSNPFTFCLLLNQLLPMYCYLLYLYEQLVQMGGKIRAVAVGLQRETKTDEGEGFKKKQKKKLQKTNRMGRLQSGRVVFEWRLLYCFDKCSLRRTSQAACHLFLSSLRRGAERRRDCQETKLRLSHRSPTHAQGPLMQSD